MGTSSSLYRKNIAGFTIVELLIVIVVIGILAAITIIAYNGIQAKATVASLQSDLENSNKQMLSYLTTSSTGYPTAIDCTASPAANTICLKSSGTTTYQFSVNNASLNAPTYCITATSGTTSYYIGTSVSSPTVGACPGHGAGGVAAVTNLVQNPGFESYTSNWGLGGSGTRSWSRVSTVSHSGTYAAEVVCSGDATGQGIYTFTQQTVSPNTTYTASVWIKGEAGKGISLELGEFNSAAAMVGSRSSSGTYTATGGWQRLTVTKAMGSTAASSDIVVRNVAAVVQTFDVDDVMVTQGASAYNYADGNSLNWVWNGATNYSTSTGPAL